MLPNEQSTRQDQGNLLDELQEALKITQRTYEGTFENGYTIFVTGHEMNAIKAAIRRMRAA